MPLLALVTWLDTDDAHALQRGEERGASLPAALLAPFCSAHGLPWGEKITSLAAFAGPPPERLRRLHRGRVRVELDVPWVLQDLKLASRSSVVDELLGLWTRRRDREEVAADLRRLEVLAGRPPASRRDAILGLLRGRDVADVVLFRPLSDDDVERYVEEG